MSTNKKSFALLLVHMGITTFMLACMAIAVGSTDLEPGTLQLENGVVEVVNENGDSEPIAGNSSFELVGELQSVDPWTVAGTVFETNEATQIEDGLEVGNIVRVRGIILEDGTWLALFIELAEEQTDPIIILIGVVDSIDPWVVKGIELNVTDTTVIEGEITVGMIVRVEILLLSDGTWEVLSIAPLGDSMETPGCVTVIATIESIEGDQIQFQGWPTALTFGQVTPTQTVEATATVEPNGSGEEDGDVSEDENESGDEDQSDDEEGGEEQGDEEPISAGQVVLAVICVSDDGTLVIAQIVVLNTDNGGEGGTSEGGEKVLVCHKPLKNRHTLSLPPSAVPAHLGHGDTLGACP